MNKLKIYMVGNFTAPWCSEVHWAKCLEKLGHTVTRKQENTLRAGMIVNEVKGHDLFLWVRTWEGFVNQRDLDDVRALGIPSVNIHLDLFVGISREATLDTDPRWRTDFVFTADGDPASQKVFEAHGINHHWLKAGVFDDACVMFEPNDDPELQGDIVFVGGGKEYAHKEWPYRKQLIEFLEKNYPNQYRKYGHPQRLVREDDLNQLYANAKIVIGDSLNVGFHHPNYWSDRIYETTGRGGFIIHPQIEGLQDEFETLDFKVDDGGFWDKAPAPVELVTYEYGNWTMLKQRIDYFLKEDKYREEIRKNGFERTKRDHTYTKRLQEMLDIVFSPNALETPEPPEKAVVDVMIEKYTPPFKVNLGAGTDIQPDYINVDMISLPGIDVVHNLMKYPWPFDDNSVSHIRAIDVIEHLPPYIGEEHGVIKFIEEAHRILQPGGELFIQTPGWRAEFLWIDPTHVRGFDIQSMDFFDPTTHFGKTTGFYSECKFKVKAQELPNHNLRFWMEKI
jgi:hypothetical protein